MVSDQGVSDTVSLDNEIFGVIAFYHGVRHQDIFYKGVTWDGVFYNNDVCVEVVISNGVAGDGVFGDEVFEMLLSSFHHMGGLSDARIHVFAVAVLQIVVQSGFEARMGFLPVLSE